MRKAHNSKLKTQNSTFFIPLPVHHNVFSFLFLDLVNTLCFSFCVVFRITFAKVLFCAGDVNYFSIFFQENYIFLLFRSPIAPRYIIYRYV